MLWKPCPYKKKTGALHAAYYPKMKGYARPSEERSISMPEIAVFTQIIEATEAPFFNSNVEAFATGC